MEKVLRLVGTKTRKAIFVTSIFLFSVALNVFTQTLAAGQLPELHIELETKKIDLHSPVEIRVKTSHAPPDSSIALHLSPLMPVGNVYPTGVWSPGCNGPLTASSISTPVGGVLNYQWNGHTTWHAPSDAPERCRKVLAGQYQIIVKLYAKQELPLVGWYRPPEPLARSVSEVFEIVGALDVSRVKHDLNGRIVSHVWEALELPNSSSMIHDAMVEKGEFADEGHGVFCMNKEMPFLYEGFVRSCTSVPVVTPLGLRLPYENYIDVRPRMTVSKNVEHMWSNLLAARTAVATPLLDKLGLSFANEDQEQDLCQSQSGRKWCRGRIVYAKSNVRLLISVRDWKYLPANDVWLFHFLSSGSRDHKLVFKENVFACVDGVGKVLGQQSAAWGSKPADRIWHSFRNGTLHCGK